MSNENTSGFRSGYKPTWCPGCGDYAVLSGLERALVELGVSPHRVAVVSGIGCSSRLPFFMNTYGFHSAHGRALSVATGLKVARPDLTVVVVGGDGDALAIGGNHFFHTLRRNVDLTYILMDNQIYGMTKGQAAPTSEIGLCTKSTPYGNPDRPVDPAWVALTCGATFVAQTLSSNPKQLAALVLAGIKHRGASFINVMSPCVTFHKEANKDTFKSAAFEIEANHDSRSLSQALELVRGNPSRFPLGILYQDAEPADFGTRIDAAIPANRPSDRVALEAVLNAYG